MLECSSVLYAAAQNQKPFLWQSKVAGSNIPIEWHISTDLGARGVSQVFQEQGITGIVVKHINP